MTQDILSCAVDRWASIWGDPALSGAVFTLGYAVAALLVFGLARRAPRGQGGLWWLCGAVLIVLAVNIHLDLHAFPGSLARCMAHAQGWYAQRGAVQLLGLVMIALLATLTLLWVLFRHHTTLRANKVITCGMALTLAFTLIRGFEVIYSHPVGPITIGKIMEGAGIALIILGAWLRLRARPAQSPPDTRRFT